METENPNYGFYGIFGRHDDPGAAWVLTNKAVAKATGCPAKDVRRFLDSRQGRLFAQGVIELMSEKIALETAVDVAVAKLMDHKIGLKDENDYGIQAGLPYLKGFACHCKLEADTGEDWPPYTYPFL